MFSIETEKVRLVLEVVPVDSLFRHERVIPHIARKLILEFKNWVNLENPIIIDENGIVLDGNHRVYVFKKLGFRYMPVCRINYFHQGARLRYWFRMLGDVWDPEVIRKIVEDHGGCFREVTDQEALRKGMEEDCFCCGICDEDFQRGLE